MADSASDKPERSAADKERSRQLSRPVTGREAARNVGLGGRSPGQQGRRGQGGGGRGGQGQGGRDQGHQSQRPRAGRGPAPRYGGRPAAARPGARRPSARRPPARRPGYGRRSRSNLFLWGAIGLVVVIVAVIVVVSQTSKTTTKGVHYTPRPVPATILDEITHVPMSAFNAVGTGIAGAINVPTVEKGQKPLTSDGKPEVFGLYGEFCPYCAAERWAVITSLSRFGTFTGLRTMQSSPVDVYPRTQTFEFDTATYTSPYITAKLVEYYGQDKATGSHPVINTATKEEVAIVKKYDNGYAIPFTDFGNKIFSPEVSYTPVLLKTLSRATIAAGLKDPTAVVTKVILGTANYMSAAVCYMDGGKPGSVCTSSGVQAAAKALKIKV